MPRLKIKDDMRYRKGSTNETKNCKHCAYYIADNMLVGAGVKIDLGPRCWLIGLGQSIRYRVWEDHTCDRQVSTYTPPAINSRKGADHGREI
jgi:hypothetical protein